MLLSGLIKPQGTPGLVLLRLREGAFSAIFSEPMLLELLDVVSRPKFTQKYNLGSEDSLALMGLLLLRGEAVAPKRRIQACRDPQDDKFLEAAVDGRADALVSGDADLLALHPFEGTPILSPAAFLLQLESA